MHKKRTQPKIKIFQFNKVSKYSHIIQQNPLISKLNDLLKTKNVLIPLRKKFINNHKPSKSPAITLNNNKPTSQFLKFKNSTSTNHKNNFGSFSFKINSLDTSPQIPNSNSNSFDYEKAITEIKIEIDKLNLQVKAQKNCIEKLSKENQKLDNKLNNLKEKKTNIIEKYQALKENQKQLMLLIKIVEKSGVDLDGMISQWNEKIEKEIKNKKNEVRENDNNSSNNDSGDSFVPITLGNNQKSITKKTILRGIPKLRFDNIKKENESRREEKNKKNKKNKNTIIVNTFHNYSSDDKNILNP